VFITYTRFSIVCDVVGEINLSFRGRLTFL